MPYFVTFYSYKGGVGRTLSLANVAWLLANHPTEPARVLTVDFDLGAPGLSHVLRLKTPEKSLGVVDYVTDFIVKAEVPNISKFIHKTAYSNIDIVPAGKLDANYQQNLEQIDWKNLYEGAFGFELIERFKKDISSLDRSYDYVLIDSLTGYTDVGGICVNQLPDTVVLMFRLNQQNLDGIKVVYETISRPNVDGRTKDIIPIVTPSWPFYDEAASHWIAKAQQIFPVAQLKSISFDGSLSYGERIVSEESARLPFGSKILEDYRDLASRIRESNAVDCLTIWENLRSYSFRGRSDRAEDFLNLLSRRPNNFEYWEAFALNSRLGIDGKLADETTKKLVDLVEKQVADNNKFALYARATIKSNAAANDDFALAFGDADPIMDIDRALQLDANFIDAFLLKGQIYASRWDYPQAISVLEEARKQVKTSPAPTLIALYSRLADAYLGTYDGHSALAILDELPDKGSIWAEIGRIRSKALYFEGFYSAALNYANKYAQSALPDSPVALLPSQILAAMGMFEDAEKSLSSSKSLLITGDFNLVEAYLAVNPEVTMASLKERINSRRDTRNPVMELLLNLAAIFLTDVAGKPLHEPVYSNHLAVPIPGNRWQFFEMVALLRAKERGRTLSPQALDASYRVVEHYMNAKEYAFVRASRATIKRFNAEP